MTLEAFQLDAVLAVEMAFKVTNPLRFKQLTVRKGGLPPLFRVPLQDQRKRSPSATFPGIAAHVIAALFPETGLIVFEEAHPFHPLC